MLVLVGAAPPPEAVAPPGGDGDAGDLLPPPTGGSGNVGDECAATVVAVDGDYIETLMCGRATDLPGDCICQGAGERAGTYEITATLGDQTQTRTVEVTADVCHVIPEDVTFFGPR